MVSQSKKFVVKLFTVLSLTFAMGIASGCTRVGPGHVGIKVDMAGSNKGVLDKPIQTGYVFYNPVSQDVVEYPTYIQTAKWTKDSNEGKPVDESITFTNKDSMVVNADISISYSLKDSDVPKFYVKFLAKDQEDLETKFTHGFLRNVARDCFDTHAGKYSIEQIMGDNAAFLKDVRGCIQDQVTPFGVSIEQFGFIGAPRPPQTVIDAINMKVQAQQVALQKQMELAQTQADAAKRVAEAEGNAKAQVAQATGEAEANKLRNSQITTQLIEMRKQDNAAAWIGKWNGQPPHTIIGDKGNALINIPQ